MQIAIIYTQYQNRTSETLMDKALQGIWLMLGIILKQKAKHAWLFDLQF